MDGSQLGELQNSYFLLRHGETPYQVDSKGKIYPWPEPLPIVLTKKGRQQIEAISKGFKEENIDLIYSSDMPRAVQTAEIVAEKLGLKVKFDKRIREHNLGIYRGGTKKRFYQDFPDLRQRFDKKPKNGESWLGCQKRIVDFLKDIDEKHKNRKILIVGHGDPLWLLEGAVKGLSEKKLLAQKLTGKAIKVGELRVLSAQISGKV